MRSRDPLKTSPLTSVTPHPHPHPLRKLRNLWIILKSELFPKSSLGFGDALGILAELGGVGYLPPELLGFACTEEPLLPRPIDQGGALKAEIRRGSCVDSLPPPQLPLGVPGPVFTHSGWGPSSNSLPEAFSLAAPYPRTRVMKIC